MMPWRGSLKLMILVAALHADATDAVADAAVAVVEPSAGHNAEAVSAIAQQMEIFGHDLEQLRLFMGVARVSDLDIGIRSAMPRDLYFQTLTLWRKTDRLMFEIARDHNPPPPIPVGDIQMSDILPALQQASGILRQVLDELELSHETKAAPPLNTDLFTAVLNLNRQLDAMLERRFAPTDVYTEITLAIGYAARLLARYPDAIRIPDEPPFEPNKLSGDVYHRLIACLQIITRIFQILELPVLTIDIRQTEVAKLTSGDVFAVAALIVSQLDFLYKRMGIVKPPPQGIYPGLKFPAHSYQRVGILQAQLEQLECYASVDCRPTTSGKVGHESVAPEN